MAGKYQEQGSAVSPAQGESWLAGVYEVNAVGQAWLGYDVLAGGTTRFAAKDAACAALGVSFDGDEFTSEDPRVVTRFRRRLPKVMLLNSRHDPGQLAAFVQRAPHLNGAGLMTFACSDSQRSVEAMTRELLPASDMDEARTRLLAVIDGASAVPERDAAEQFLELLGVPPESTGPAAGRAARELNGLPGEFSGYWHTYVGNATIGLLHAACWAAPRARRGRR